MREELHTVVLPPGAFCVGKSLADLSLDRSEVTITAIRRDGIVGRNRSRPPSCARATSSSCTAPPRRLQQGEARLLMG